MMTFRLVILVALSVVPVCAVSAQTPGADSARAQAPPPRPLPDAATIASAYLDADARELVRLARERRRVVDRSIEAYETTARERISAGLRALWRDRLLWEREVATRVSWQRDGPVVIEVLGAREVFPAFITRAHVPAGLERSLPQLAFDPADALLVAGWRNGSDDIPHPLAEGSESDYRFRSGDTTVIRLPDGRDVRLLELELLPRRKSWHLVRGSLWLDAETHALVRATFRLADDYDFERDGDEDIAGILAPLRVSLEYVTIEYGFWEFQWWLPRLFALRGAMTVGRAASLPFSYERTYSGYEVSGDTAGAALLAADPDSTALPPVRCPTRTSVQVRVGYDSERRSERRPPAPDTIRDQRADDELTEEQRRACERIEVVMPEDTAALLVSSALSPAPFSSGEALISDADLESIREQLDDLPAAPWQLLRPRFLGPLGAPDLLRYNRVEALSLGARVAADFGPLEASATARLGVADLEPNGEVTLARNGTRARLQLSSYRRLVSMDPYARPFTLGSSFTALFLGRDDADYYRTLGVEVTAEPALSRPRWYQWRLYAQREGAAYKETDFSVPHLFDGEHTFPANDTAQEATQYGMALRLHGAWGHDPLGLRTGAELGVDAAAGTFAYARPALTLRAGFPLPGPFVGLLEGAGGTSFGDPALQHLWRIGGPYTVRGYGSGAMTGESFWRARAELATQIPAVRLVVFSDVGWAGSFGRVDVDRWLLSAGVGVSLLDGLLRLDLARALRTPTGWRLTAYVDAWQ